MSSDYLHEIDLNPVVGGPVISPLDQRALHYFGFLAEGQEVTLVQPFTGQPRVLVSFHDANQPTAAPPMPPPPIDGIVDFSGGPPSLRYDQHHERSSLRVWLDPANVPPAGQSAMVRVRAWA